MQGIVLRQQICTEEAKSLHSRTLNSTWECRHRASRKIRVMSTDAIPSSPGATTLYSGAGWRWRESFPQANLRANTEASRWKRCVSAHTSFTTFQIQIPTSRWLSPLWNDPRLSITPHAPRDIPFGIFPQQNVWGAKESISFPPSLLMSLLLKHVKQEQGKCLPFAFPKLPPSPVRFTSQALPNVSFSSFLTS